ncbi:MAG: Gldg family protein, partial [Nitrospirota bacterium]|nr:Gldg family protein [Nitrospirota bacterium]
MEITRRTIPIGALGAGLAVAGLIVYSLVPDRLWLVTLLEGSALVCLIWFLANHFDRLKTFSAQRSTRMGANSALMVALFLAILSIVNFLGARHSIRWDFSENQNYTLAPETHRVLRNLTRDVNITIFTREKDPGYQAYKERFDSYRQASPKLTIQFIDPERQPKVAQNYGITRTDIAIFESGPQSVRITSPAEVEITGALIRVSKDTKKRLVFLEGHGERSLEDKDRGGLTLTKELLEKQGYDIGTVSLLQESAVPENTAVLIIAGPRRALTKEERDRIRIYIVKGGRLLVMVDPDTQAGMD